MQTIKIKQLLYGLIPIIIMLFSTGQLFAQSGPEGPEGPIGQTFNFVREKGYASNTNVCQVTTTYYDGLGRELQTKNSHQFHPDIVNFTEYDSYGRVSKKYLPYTTSATGYDFSAKSTQAAYYQSNHNTAYGYSQVVYDNTVNNNVIETSQPGDIWRIGGGHTSRSEITKNTTNDKLKYYYIVDDTIVASQAPYYSFPGRLIKKETIDPQGDKMYKYYNTQEQLIAKEVRTDTGSFFTHYLYDDLGLLRYVIPPIVDATFPIYGRKNLSELKKYCLYSEYDEHQRLYKKHVPGAGYTINLYDKKNRLVLSQSENLRAEGKWVFAKYDHLNRPVISGICTGTEAQHRAGLESQTIFEETRGTIAHGYTNNSYPTTVNSNDYLTITYYDNYDWQGESEETSSVSAWPDRDFAHTINNKIVGKVTGRKYKLLGTEENKWLHSATYYDDKYNEIQSVNQLYPDGLELIYRKFDYAGNLTHVKEVQRVNSRAEGFDRYFEYDTWNRLMEIKQQILGSDDLVSIAKYKYNDLWQMTEKKNHNGIDSTQYSYSLDGKPIGTQSPLFSYKLHYDKKPSNLNYTFYPRYDGNVSMMEWKSNNTTKAYRYEYDHLKQLHDGSYMYLENGLWAAVKEYGEHDITYDSNGNITYLRRTDSQNNETLHDIKNEYVGNQLVRSQINDVYYDYSYDGNGNMISDGYKGINIAYNSLDLPTRIFAGSEEVSYIYNSAGVKLATKVGDSYTYYRGSFVYNNGDMDHMKHPEGLIRKASGGYVYYYAKKDHMGSTRALAYEAGGIMRAVQTTDYYPFGLSFRNYGTNYNRYLYSGKELQDQYINGKSLMLYDFGSRNYDPMLGRWFNVDPALQFINPYTYCANNPIMYTDPDGEFILSCITAIGNFFYNTFVRSWKQGWNAWSNKENWHATTMAFRIDAGMFKGNAWQIISRFTWELPQTIMGNLGSHGHNMLGGVRSVSYYGGATAVESYGDWGGLTLGSYINGGRGLQADPNDALFQHEYGHYRQSQSSGIFYLQRYGAPSLFSAGKHKDHPVEQDANIRGYQYFMKHEGSVKWNSYNHPIHGYDWSLEYTDSNNQAALKKGRIGLQPWDFLSLVNPWMFLGNAAINTFNLNFLTDEK